ncbi:hypothetical protein EQH57_0146 [Dictyocoela roeselum]|nr:hypothetical protein EQH57_0146 [Dictyocoela roeselum]
MKKWKHFRTTRLYKLHLTISLNIHEILKVNSWRHYLSYSALLDQNNPYVLTYRPKRTGSKLTNPRHKLKNNKRTINYLIVFGKGILFAFKKNLEYTTWLMTW